MLLNCSVGGESWESLGLQGECSLEGLMLKLKLQYFGLLMWRTSSLEKRDAGKSWRQEEKGTTEDKMAGWHHWLDEHEFEWTLGDSDGQGGLVCCHSWGHKESDMTERLNWTELNWNLEIFLVVKLLAILTPTVFKEVKRFYPFEIWSENIFVCIVPKWR